MYETGYRPERLLPAAERTIDQKSLRAALTVARRIHETDQAAQQVEPTTKDERWELNAQLRIAEMEYEMKLRGFTRYVADNYHNPAVGILVEDLHDENVLVDADGDLLIFDPVIYLVKPEMNLPAYQWPRP